MYDEALHQLADDLTARQVQTDRDPNLTELPPLRRQRDDSATFTFSGHAVIAGTHGLKVPKLGRLRTSRKLRNPRGDKFAVVTVEHHNHAWQATIVFPYAEKTAA